MKTRGLNNTYKLDTNFPIWDHVFTVAPLVVIGTKEKNGYNLAPKHMALPFGFNNYFGFICTPEHGTYQNIKNKKEFSVSYPLTDSILLASLSATTRKDGISKFKKIIDALPTIKATSIDALFVKQSYLYLECVLFKIIDGIDNNSMIIGKIEAAFVDKNYLKNSEKDVQMQIMKYPLLAYIADGRFAKIDKTLNFPFPKYFKR